MFKFRKTGVFLTGISLAVLMANTAFAADYKVLPGDSLYKIAKLFDTTSASIIKTNKLWSSKIYPGQVLYVPAGEYTVKRGDFLYKIAKNNGISVYSLKKANNEWDNNIYPGQKLILPAGNKPATAASYSLKSQGVISYNASDVDLLARLITSEADNQPYSAKVGVGAVIVNRIKDSRFPDTIKSVIYSKDSGFYQFTPVENGMIYNTATKEARSAAYDALSGSDPSKGAVFYFDDSAKSKWIWSRPISAWIGRMVFTY